MGLHYKREGHTNYTKQLNYQNQFTCNEPEDFVAPGLVSCFVLLLIHLLNKALRYLACTLIIELLIVWLKWLVVLKWKASPPKYVSAESFKYISTQKDRDSLSQCFLLHDMQPVVLSSTQKGGRAGL